MEHVYWVIEGKVGGRPGPIWAPWEPQALYEAGIRTIVSLAAEVEVGDLTTYGFEHYTADFPPMFLRSEGLQKAFLHEALPVWRFIDEQLQAGRPTLVHCQAGKDRTGAILAGHLVLYEGWEPPEAIRHLRTLKEHALGAEGYEEAILRLEPGTLPDPRTLL